MVHYSIDKYMYESTSYKEATYFIITNIKRILAIIVLELRLK